jgi:hypothetical protein
MKKNGSWFGVLIVGLILCMIIIGCSNGSTNGGNGSIDGAGGIKFNTLEFLWSGVGTDQVVVADFPNRYSTLSCESWDDVLQDFDVTINSAPITIEDGNGGGGIRLIFQGAYVSGQEYAIKVIYESNPNREITYSYTGEIIKSFTLERKVSYTNSY